jgi:ankyrin repeat protein
MVQLAPASLAALLVLAAVASAAVDAPLADAAQRRDTEAVVTLLEHNIDVNASQADGMTALHWATQHDDVNAVKLLLSVGANAKAENEYGVTPLMLACTNGNAAIVELLLDGGADAKHAGPGGVTALMTAARTGKLRSVEALLAHGADVNVREERHQTALMWAAADGHVEVVDALLERGADFRTPLRSGFTPLFFAVREGHAEVVSRLLRAGADVNEIMRPKTENAQPTTPLLLAIENGHFELAAAVLKAGADPNARPAGYTALHVITWVRKPIRGDGNPPPASSGSMSSSEIVRKLVEHGADVNVQMENGDAELGRFTMSGSTPFLLAARASDIRFMQLLLELGADPKITNADNCMPLLAAAGVGALGDGEEAAGTDEEAHEAVRMLLEAGADVNAVDNNGETVMHGAAYQSRANLVPLLVEHGAEIDIWNRENKAGWTPLMIAHGHRPGNFRLSPETVAAIERAMRDSGVEPPKAGRYIDRRKW